MTSLAGTGWLATGPVPDLLAALDADGEEARVVGGAVRNALIGLPPGDIDIATTAPPDVTMARVASVGFDPVPTGIAHGTITAVRDGTGIEITTLREDIETFGRHAVVRFGRDWRADAERRDFTVNALSVTRDGTVHDYTNGIADLAAGRIRFIGNARRRIQEDYLRILRFFRFHATYAEGPPDAEALHACIVERAGLAGLSRERVRMELVKVLVVPRAADTLGIASDTGILGDVLGGVALPGRLARLVALEAGLGVAPDAMRRLTALAVLIPEDAERLDARLRLSRAERAVLDDLALVGRTLPPVPESVYRAGRPAAIHRVLYAAADRGLGPDDPALRADWHHVTTFAPPPCPFRGADLIAAGLEPGPFVGHALKEAETAWIKRGFPTDEDSRAAILSDVLSRHRL